MKKFVALIITICICLLSACNNTAVTSGNTETSATTGTNASSVADNSSQQTSSAEENSDATSVDTENSSTADAEKEITRFIYHPSMSLEECREGVKKALEQLPDKWTTKDIYNALGVPDFGYDYASPYVEIYCYTDCILFLALDLEPTLLYIDENERRTGDTYGRDKEFVKDNSWEPCDGILDMDLIYSDKENVPAPPEEVVPFTYDSSMSDKETAAALEKALNQLPYGWTPEQLYEILGEPHYVRRYSSVSFTHYCEMYVFGNCMVKYGVYNDAMTIPIKISYYDDNAPYNMTAFSILRYTDLTKYFTTEE